MEHHDIVIVGAGPAGLKTAEVLAAAGKDVLVLEKNSVVGPKVCAGGITVKCRGLGVPDSIFKRCFDSLILRSCYQKVRLGSDDYYVCTLLRGDLGKYMKQNAESKGALVRTGCFVERIEKDYVVAGGKKIGFDYLIGADGSNSIVRKYLGIGVEKRWIAVQYVSSGHIDDLSISFDYNSGSKYVWLFPYADSFCVGIGADIRFGTGSELKGELDSWCEKNGISLDNAKFEAAMINCDYRGFKFGNVFLIGDAGGFAFEFTGEGIYSALVSGVVAARTILDEKYDYQKDLDAILSMKKTQEWFVVILNNKFVRPFFIEFFAFLARFDYFKKLFVKIFS